MNILDIINKKKEKKELTEEEVDFFVYEYTINKTIPDYQASALLMALFLNGMSTYETYYLTNSFVKYSKQYDFKKGFEKQILIDKHSSGGIGDKVSLILCPLLACFGIRTIKISGRGLGHTGGTLDKLDALNVNTNISYDQYQKLAKKSDCIIMAQNDQLVPSDRMIYALRDVTGTVDYCGLIAASILSKKFIINSDYIFLDLKVGSGALMNTKKDAIKLANLMVDVANLMQRKIDIDITNMTQPLGRAIGNYIEDIEAYNFLNNQETSSDLKELIYGFVIDILMKTNICYAKHDAIKMIDHALASGEASKQFLNWIKVQNGKFDLKGFHPKFKVQIKAPSEGFVHYLDAKTIGIIAMELGAGRKTKNDKIDFQAGIYLDKKTNEYVHKNDVIATLYSSKKISDEVINKFETNFNIRKKPVKLGKLIVKTI